MTDGIKKPDLYFKYLVLCCLLYPLIFYARTFEKKMLSQLLIPIYVILILSYVLTSSSENDRFRILYIIPFLGICAGDLIINITPYIKLSIIPFSLTHIAFTIYFLKDIGKSKTDVIFILPPAIVSFAIFLLTQSQVDQIVLKFVYAIYLLILSTMLWRAFCYLGRKEILFWKKITCVSGAVLFFITDIMVSLMQVYKSMNLIPLIWVVYPPALFLLSIMNVRK